MCDVTRENFEELFPSIKKAIEGAAFIAIDGEFTGLSTSTLYEPALFDTPETRYNKLRKSLSQFTLCQCGISTFIPDEVNSNKYNAHTYNFFLFPHSFGPLDARFSCQASAMEFLTLHNFDFNQFIKHGVSYLSKDQEKLLRKYHEQNSVNQNINSSSVRQLDENYINPALTQLDDFIRSDLNNDVMKLNSVPQGIAQYMLLKSIEKRFDNISCTIEPKGIISIKKILNVDEKFNFDAEYEKIFRNAVGFSAVIQLLVLSKKPLIGHNLLSDLIFIYGKFHQNLPDTYKKFKQEIHRLFPHIYDTKCVAYSLRKEFKNVNFFDLTSLEELYKAFSSSAGLFYKLYTPHITHADGFKKYESDDVPHEAGYDAYITGYVFLRLAHMTASKDIRSVDSHPLEIHEHLAAIKPLENYANLARAAVRYLKFGGEDPPVVLPESFIVVLKDRKKTISAAQVAQDFLPFGSVDVKLMSHSQALVAVSHRRRARDVLKAFSRNKFYTVVKYSWWYHSQEAGFLLWYGGATTTCIIFAGLLYFSYKRLSK